MSGHAEVDGGIPVMGGDLAHLGEFLPICGEADRQALGLAGPACAVCFLDAGQQVVVDFGEPGLNRNDLELGCEPSRMPGVTHGHKRILAAHCSRACHRAGALHAISGRSARSWAGLLERYGLTPLPSSLSDPDLSAQQLAEDLLKHASITECTDRLRLQEECALVSAGDRRHYEVAFVSSQLERTSYRGPLADVEHVGQATSARVTRSRDPQSGS